MMHGSYYPMMRMYNVGDRLRFRCNYGYEMHYSNNRYEYATCGKDGNWDQYVPKCKSNRMSESVASSFLSIFIILLIWLYEITALGSLE